MGEVISYEEKMAELASRAAARERPAISNVGLRAGVLSIGGQPVPGNKLDAIIIADVHTNLYYSRAYDPNEASNPDCYAYSVDGKDMRPHESVANPQAATCAECPMAQWGSSPKGGRGKACQNRRSLALLPASVATPEDVSSSELAILKLPVMSVAGYGSYVQKCSTVHRRPTLGVVTTISTKPDPKSQFKVTFQDAKLVDQSLYGALIDRMEGAELAMMQVYEPNAPESAEPKSKKY